MPWPDPYRMGRKRKVRGLVRIVRRRAALTEPAAVALDMLARCQDPPRGLAAAVEPLTMLLGDAAVRPFLIPAALALGSIGDRRAVDPLAAALANPGSQYAFAAAVALAHLGDPRGIDLLLAGLRGDGPPGRPFLRLQPPGEAAAVTRTSAPQEAHDALVALGDQVVDPLVALLADPDANARQAAAAVLHDIGWTPTTGEQRALLAVADGDWDAVAAVGASAVPVVAARLADPDPDPGMAAGVCLDRLDDPRGGEHLVSRFGDHEGITVLAQALATEGDAARHAEQALDVMGERAVVPLLGFLARAPSDQRPVVRAVDPVLERLTGPERTALVAALHHPDRAVRGQAARRLQDGGWTPATDAEHLAMATAFEQWSDVVERGADAVPVLLDLLADPYDQVAAGAAKALGEIGDRRAVEPLIALLTGELATRPTVVPPYSSLDIEARGDRTRAAATALGALGDLRAVPALVGVLTDEPLYDLWAVEALIALDDRSIVPTLVPALVAPPDNTRKGSARVLKALGWQPSSPDDRARLAIAEGRWADALQESPHGIDMVAAIAEARSSAETWRRREWEEAAYTLAEAGDPRAIEPLVELYRYYREEKPEADRRLADAERAFDRNDDLFWHEKLDLDVRDARRSADEAAAALARARDLLGRFDDARAAAALAEPSPAVEA